MRRGQWIFLALLAALLCGSAAGPSHVVSNTPAGQMSNSLPIAIFRFGWTNSANMAWEFAAPLPHSATVHNTDDDL
jgi:hypothetical protein